MDVSCLQVWGPLARNSNAVEGESHWPSVGHAFGQGMDGGHPYEFPRLYTGKGSSAAGKRSGCCSLKEMQVMGGSQKPTSVSQTVTAPCLPRV